MVGTWAVYETYIECNWRPLIAAIIGTILALLISRLSIAHSGYTFVFFQWFQADSLWTVEVWRSALAYGPALFVALSLLAVCSVKCRSAVAPMTIFIVPSIGVLIIPFIAVVYRKDSSGNIQFVYDILQILKPIQWMLAVSIVLALISLWQITSTKSKVLLVVSVAALTFMPIIAKLHDATVLQQRPQDWHEFADNRAIMTALQSIPIQGSVIATNDLRYPANNYSRDLSQFQIAALFGHQAYGSVATYERPSNSATRLQEQQLLRREDWSSELNMIACQKGWTHILLAKYAPHVETVPGKILYDSSSYSVYVLPDCGRREPLLLARQFIGEGCRPNELGRGAPSRCVANR